MRTTNTPAGGRRARRPSVARWAAAAALAVATTGVTLGPAGVADAAPGFFQVRDFGDNPGGLKMEVYEPPRLQKNPAIVVALHLCGGTGQGFFRSTEFASLADKHGFVVIYPSATDANGRCFDVWSQASKTRNGRTDPLSIVNMAKHTLRQYNGDTNRVFVVGASNGGMTANALLGTYPDVFQAGASFMGVPMGCFADKADFNPSNPGASNCTGGRVNKTPQQWGDIVRASFPGYRGPARRMQLWHGTNDQVVKFSLMNEAVEQWTNLHGIDQTADASDNVAGNSSWQRKRYLDSSRQTRVEAIAVQGRGHDLPRAGMARVTIEGFFGLTGTP